MEYKLTNNLYLLTKTFFLMKKILTLCVVALVALSMAAKPYNHSIGLVAGSGIGLQYKTMVTDHFTLIEEFGYLGSLCAAGRYADSSGREHDRGR